MKPEGALYGLTAFGGQHGTGTVFKITLDGTYAVVYSFGAAASDGAVPTGGLVQASDGNFYGATSSGGAHHCVQIPSDGGNCGTIFRMTPTGAVTVIHSFGRTPDDGVTPNGSLIQASDGQLLGTASNGGASGAGTVFRLTLDGALSTLHAFSMTFTSDGYLDGIAPQGPLLQGRDGAFYGTTTSGGRGAFWCQSLFGCGTVYRMTADGTTSVLHSFATDSESDGSGPAPYLIQAWDGHLYGTTHSGGAHRGSGNGTAFRLTTDGALTVLHSFGPLGQLPSDPASGLTEGRDGAFYGVTSYNGQLGAVGAFAGSGTVFKLVIN
jgi:uncharacterized repeat protein (TIGR03803 family)